MSKKTSPYLTNKFLLEEVKKSKQTPKVNGRAQPTEELSKSFMLLVDKYSKKPNFRGYDISTIEEMRGEALYALCKGWLLFNPDKSNNPFSYFTQITHNGFISVIKKLHKTMRVRDECISQTGALGSYKHQDLHNYHQGFWDDYEYNKKTPVRSYETTIS